MKETLRIRLENNHLIVEKSYPINAEQSVIDFVNDCLTKISYGEKMKQQLCLHGKDDAQIFYCEICRDDVTKANFTFSAYERKGNQIVHCPKCHREEPVKINRRVQLQ